MNSIAIKQELAEGYAEFNYAGFYDWIVTAHPDWSKFVEVGCWKGFSTAHLAKALHQTGRQFEMYAVDLWDFTIGMAHRWERLAQRFGMDVDRSTILHELYHGNLLGNGVRELVQDIRADSAESAARFSDESLDFVFIDADHEYEAVRRDITAWYRKVRPGGILAGHDYNLAKHRHNVVRAVDELLPQRKLFDGDCWFARREECASSRTARSVTVGQTQRESRGKVFEIGFGKTGSRTLAVAAQILGFSNRHWIGRDDAHPEFERQAIEAYQTGTFDFPIHSYDYVGNFLAPCFREMDERYPGSKFILPCRDEEDWLRSYENWVEFLSSRPRGSFSQVYHWCLYQTLAFSRDRYLRAYRRHNADVMEHFQNRPDDLLIIDVCAGDGWEKLCGFLRVEVPNQAFPHENQSDYSSRSKKHKSPKTHWKVTQLTTGTSNNVFHWFGYYDIPKVDPTGRFSLCHEVRFQNRRPESRDTVTIKVIDLETGQHRDIGESSAWSWQQATMAQWLPDGRIVFNDRDPEGGQFLSQIVDPQTGNRQTVPRAIYAISPCGTWSLSVDFSRLNDVRPGYGYAGVPDLVADHNRPDETGIWRIDLRSGESTLVIALAEMACWGTDTHKHWFNHIKISPDGRRFTFKDRWRERGRDGFFTRSYVAGIDGSNIRHLADMTSHVMWVDDEHLIFWSRDGVYVQDLDSGNRERLPQMVRDAHVDPMRDGNFLFDEPKSNLRHLRILNSKTGSVEPVTTFSGHQQCGEFRCDLHAQSTPSGILCDSTQDGGRQVYLIQNTR